MSISVKVDSRCTHQLNCCNIQTVYSICEAVNVAISLKSEICHSGYFMQELVVVARYIGRGFTQHGQAWTMEKKGIQLIIPSSLKISST